jgi:hypothetical protein
MEFEITINLKERYPAFLHLPDPKQLVLSILDTQYAIFQSQRSVIPTTHLTEMMETIQQATSSSSVEIKGTNESLRSTVKDMQNSDERVRHAASEIKSTNEIVRSNVSMLKSVTDTLQHSVDEFNSLKETLKQLPIILSKSQSKGVIGEVCVLDFLKESLSSTDYVIDNTSTTARSGDIRISKRDYECIIDSKFYKQTVPKKEVEKLKRDMFESKVRCGVLVSLTSGVSGYKSIDMDVYVNENDKLSCVMILTNVKDQPERVLVGVKTLELIWEFFLKKTTSSSMSNSVRDKSISILSNIMESADDLRDLVRQYERHKKTVIDSLTNFHEMLVKNVEKHVARVEEKLNAFTEC